MLYLSENYYGIPGVPEELDCTFFPDPTPAMLDPIDNSQESTSNRVNALALDQLSEKEEEKNEG